MTLTRLRTIRLAIAGTALATAVTLAAAPVASAAVTVPPDVAASLAAFPTDPQGAMTAWVDWAQDQPMTTASRSVEARVNCRIDAAGVSRCVSYVPNLPKKGWKRNGVTYTLANGRTQVFKSKGQWVRNNDGADTNPFTNTSRFYPYNYWLPWLTPGVVYDTFVDSDGWYSVQEQNSKGGDDQYPVTMVKVAPDGLTAKFLQQYQDGRVAISETITLTDVPAINVPESTKQKL